MLGKLFGKSVAKEKYSNFEYNDGVYYEFQQLPYTPSNNINCALPSSYIFKLGLDTINFQSQTVLEDTLFIRKTHGINRTIWGIRNENGIFSTEYYFYRNSFFPHHTIDLLGGLFEHFAKKTIPLRLDSDYFLLSINVDNNRIFGFNYYTFINPDKNDIGLFPVAESYFYDLRDGSKEKKNKYHGYRFAQHNAYQILNGIVETSKILYPNENEMLALEFLKFPYLNIAPTHSIESHFVIPYCYTVKSDSVLCVYFYGLNIDSFIEFLKFHQYPQQFIENISISKSRIHNIRFDVGVDFYLKNNQFIIYKTSIYGSL